MRGSPCSAVVAVAAERLIGRPASLARGESLNKESWSRTGPNTWLVEPDGLPSRVIEIQGAGLGRLAMQDGFSQWWNESQIRTFFDSFRVQW